MQTCELGWLKHTGMVPGFFFYLKPWIPRVVLILYQEKAGGTSYTASSCPQILISRGQLDFLESKWKKVGLYYKEELVAWAAA